MGEWCSVDDPHNILEDESPKLPLEELLLRLSVPIITNIFKELECFLSTARQGMRALLNTFTLFDSKWNHINFQHFWLFQ